MTEKPVKRKRAGTFHYKGKTDTQNQYMILIAFSGLLTKPVHEKTMLEVVNKSADSNVNSNCHRRDSCEKTDKKPYRSYEFSDNDENSNGSGKAVVRSEDLYRFFVSGSTTMTCNREL